MKRMLTLMMTAVLLSGAISCKKSSGSSNTPSSKSVFFKITLNPVINSNQGTFTGAVNALLPNYQYATWKVNGVTRANETTIAFTISDFQKGVITLETTANVTTANLSIGGSTNAQAPYTVLVEPTINGQAQTPTTISVTTVMDRSFSF